MGNLFKNITIALGIITVVFGGYYLYTESINSSFEEQGAEQALQSMLANTSVFISYSQELDRINLDLALFEDKRFRSLRLYTTPVKEQATGRSNPFSDSSQ
ncbi:MAG: hypothetical protein AAB618_00065 [Patescibacteria group bacterium]